MISLLVAASRNGVIGTNNRLPWRLPADLKRFKQLTLGHPIIMGRKTFESIGKPLPGRSNIVITRQKEFSACGAKTASSLEEALQMCEKEKETFVIGGAQIFEQALPYANRIYLTKIDADLPGDAYFPELDQSWRIVEKDPHPADSKNPYPYVFLTLERK